MYAVAQIAGVGAMLSLFCLYQQKSRRAMLLCKLCADFFWFMHYGLLGAVAGMIPNLVGVGRELVFVWRKRARWASYAVWPILFVLLNFLLAARTFSAWYNLLPIAASAAVSVSLWLDRGALTRAVGAYASCSFLVYDVLVHSYIGIVNESIALLSIVLFLCKTLYKGESAMKIFSPDVSTEKELTLVPDVPIAGARRILPAEADEAAFALGAQLAKEIRENKVADFEHPADKMCHVSTFIVVDGTVYMSYYANTHEPSEDPRNQTARLAYAPLSDLSAMTYLDVQSIRDTVDGKTVDMVYDTILMQKDARTLYVMWTARVEENYYRFYRPFYIDEKRLGETAVNRFRVGDTVNDFSASGIRSALAANGIPCKRMFSDIGIMQKMSWRTEDGVPYCYTGAYSGDFNCIIKSRDLVEWEYVSQPDFLNKSKWENATYVLGDSVYYFVRQWEEIPYGFLTKYDLITRRWSAPVEVGDCQSRSDFIEYGGELYLIHAPINREHLGVLRIDRTNLAKSEVVLVANMEGSCFYPFVDTYTDGTFGISYTVSRRHIRLATFDPAHYFN